MAIRKSNRITTGYGCKVDEDMHGGPHGSIRCSYYECDTLSDVIDCALDLLENHYSVTVFSNGYYNPRTYTRYGKDDILRDFGPIAGLEDVVDREQEFDEQYGGFGYDEPEYSAACPWSAPGMRVSDFI